MALIASSFIGSSGGVPQPSSNSGTSTYSAHVSEISARLDGFRMMQLVQALRYANTGCIESRR